MTREEQFKFTEGARSEIMKWAEENGIDLFRVEFDVWFGSNFSMSV